MAQRSGRVGGVHNAEAIDIPRTSRQWLTFKSRLERNSIPVPECGCWIWLGCSDRHGYGMMTVSVGRSRRCHRLSYAIFNGPVPDKAHVLHRCDMPACINPDHLFLGNPTANVADRVSKGRSGRLPGEAHHNSKITNSVVAKIRADPRLHKKIAEEHGLARAYISKIKRGDSWQCVVNASPDIRGQVRGEKVGTSILTEAQVRSILSDGRSNQRIADDYGVSRKAVSLIKRRINWKHVQP